MHNEIYLDNSATTRPYDEVIEYINNINSEYYGNPSSLHSKGLEAERLLKKARDQIASSLKVASREIIFTSGGTEANNLAIKGYLEANPRKGKHIITTKIEHPSVLEVYKDLSGKGYEVLYLEVDCYGRLDPELVKRVIRPDTALISLIYVNNETGTVQNLMELTGAIKDVNKNTVIHADAVQAYGKLAIEPYKLNIDLMSFSSHKIHGPKGVGALYVNSKIKLKPILLGGGQETLLRSGTENVSGICGFGRASDIIHKNIQENYLNAQSLKQFFINNLSNYVEKYDIISDENALPFILNVAFHGIKAEVLLHHLEERNIYVSTGSACSSRKKAHSHVLTALGIKPNIIEGAIRFSFSSYTTKDDINEALKALGDIVPKIKIKKI